MGKSWSIIGARFCQSQGGGMCESYGARIEGMEDFGEHSICRRGEEMEKFGADCSDGDDALST